MAEPFDRAVADGGDGTGPVTTGSVALEDLWELPDDASLPPLDRADARPRNGLQAAWRADGVVILPRFMPEALIDAYVSSYPEGGWGIGTPYLSSVELRSLATWKPLVDILGDLIGEEMGLHLNLTFWRSTTRDWHQDDYLNPAFVNGWYAATWIALDDIHPDSGPFQFVRGTHRWPVVRRSKMLDALGEDGSDPDWPWRSEAILTPLYEARFADEGKTVESFMAKKGDVLIWHGRTVHRGSVPNDPTLERRSLISHYSGLSHRLDMPTIQRDPNGSAFFVP